MKLIKTKLNGIYIIEPNISIDERGMFIKVFDKEAFIGEKLRFGPEENYFTLSKRNVLRGMHFQIPPKDHAKIVYVTQGAIRDVVLDIRAGSPTYGKYLIFDLSPKNHLAIFISEGFAHGFLSLKDNSLVVYLQSTCYSQNHDKGIRTDSFGLNWGVTKPIVSARDQSFPRFREFKTPFAFKKRKKQ